MVSFTRRELYEMMWLQHISPRKLAEKYNLNVKQIVLDKLEVNARKYPVDKARGSAKKYNEL